MIDKMKVILNSCGELLISPKGKSMRPYLKEKRDKVRVIPAEGELSKYDIVLYKSNGLYILHRIIGKDKGCYLICGDNNYIVEKIPKEDIIGVVVEIIRRDRIHISMTSVSAEAWVKIWYIWNLKKEWIKLSNLMKRLLRKI